MPKLSTPDRDAAMLHATPFILECQHAVWKHPQGGIMLALFVVCGNKQRQTQAAYQGGLFSTIVAQSVWEKGK